MLGRFLRRIGSPAPRPIHFHTAKQAVFVACAVGGE